MKSRRTPPPPRKPRTLPLLLLWPRPLRLPRPLLQRLRPVRSRAEVEEIVDKALQRQLNPMKRTLAEALDPSIKVSDVVGGIGWIFGLFGVAAIFSNRRRGREDAGKKEA